MRYFSFFIFGCLMVLGQSQCKRTNSGSTPGIACPAFIAIPTFTLKLLDKDSGNSLIFGSGAKVKPSQVVWVNLIKGKKDTVPFFNLDSVQKTFMVVSSFNIGTDTSYLSVPGYSKDTFLIGIVSNGAVCPQNIVGSIAVNGQSFCNPCTNYTITLSK